MLKSAYVRALSARPTTCLAAEGKIRALTPITPILNIFGVGGCGNLKIKFKENFKKKILELVRFGCMHKDLR